MDDQDKRKHELDLTEIYQLVEVMTKTMHLPKLAPIHQAAMRALEGHAEALLPEPEPVPEPPVEEQGEEIQPPPAGNGEQIERRF